MPVTVTMRPMNRWPVTNAGRILLGRRVFICEAYVTQQKLNNDQLLKSISEIEQKIAGSLTIRKIDEHIRRLPISADAKALISNLAKTTWAVGEHVVQIGRRIISFILDLAKQFPNTAFGVIIGITLTALIAAVPFLGPLLAPFLGPLLIAFGLAAGAVQDMRETALRTRVAILEAEMQALKPTA